MHECQGDIFIYNKEHNVIIPKKVNDSSLLKSFLEDPINNTTTPPPPHSHRIRKRSQIDSPCTNLACIYWKKKWSHFDKKKLSHFWKKNSTPGFRVIGEY